MENKNKTETIYKLKQLEKNNKTITITIIVKIKEEKKLTERKIERRKNYTR